MYERLRERLAVLIHLPDTNTWDRRYWDGRTTPLTNTEMRRMVRALLIKEPGPFLMHTQLVQEVKSIMRELRERSKGGEHDQADS